MKKKNKSTSSFRDPSGFIFFKNGKLLRQIIIFYKENYDLLLSSGLYDNLVKKGLLIPHREISTKYSKDKNAYKIIAPEIIPFISHPYEWCFGQLKEASLLTLKIQGLALQHSMSLKDASVYNIQFIGYKPIFIDTLSFEKYVEGKPWVAYKQFCQHFLASLALMSKKDIRLNQLLRIYMDGVPLDFASKLLPNATKLNFGILSHIHLHAKSQQHYSDKTVKINKYKMGKKALLTLITSLENTVKGLKLNKMKTEWGNYYSSTNYSRKSFAHKSKLVESFIKLTKAKTLWDLGANTGEFSELASKNGIYTIAFDIDPIAVEKAYRKVSKKKTLNILPLLMDLTNPPSNMGWAGKERESLSKRGPADALMALALIHHLAISNNLPFEMIADYFSSLSRYLIIEFIPKEDSQVQRLLATREDVFPDYNEKRFEKDFGNYYKILKKEKLIGSNRIMYLMKKK